MFPSIIKNQTTTVNKSASAFLSSLIRIQHSLYKKETSDWVTARESALDLSNPNRYDIVQFYRDIDTDLFIRGQKNQRINRIKNRKIKVVNKSTGELDEDKTKLLNGKKWFREFRHVAMVSKFEGQRVVYFDRGKKGEPIVKVVYPEHVIPEKGIIVKQPWDQEGVSYLEGQLAKFVIPIGDAESLGMYENLANAYILRKHSWSSWDEFEELFGVPLRWISTNATDKKILDELEAFAITMGSANYAIVPGDAKMEVKDGQTTDAFQVFNEKRKAVNEEVSMFINGHAEASNDKGSRAKSETIIHKTQDEILEDDKADVLTIINDDLLPMLSFLFNYPFDDNDEVQFDDTNQLEPTEKATIYKTVNDMGFELDQEDVEKSLGVKIVGKKEPIKPVTSSEVEKQKKDKPQNLVPEAIIQMHLKINELYHVQ